MLEALGAQFSWSVLVGSGGVFVTQDGGDDLFVYYKEIEKDKPGFKTLEEGQRVSFDVEPGQNGKMQAVNVCKL